MRRVADPLPTNQRERMALVLRVLSASLRSRIEPLLLGLIRG
jgi:hypothetical protein